MRIADPLLFQCPFLSATDVGTAFFTDEEAETLRDYLLKGGFLWVDDFWGPYAWDNWVSQISKVLPPAQFPIRDLGLDHPIRRTLFEFTDLPQIPSISFWRRSGGDTSERYELSAEPHLRGIADEHGRLMVVMTHNTDISDAWEREAEDPAVLLQLLAARLRRRPRRRPLRHDALTRGIRLRRFRGNHEALEGHEALLAELTSRLHVP